MNTTNATPARMDTIDLAILDDLTSRVEDIDNCYRAVAEKVGQLYMKADENHIEEITTQLDKPMRNASENEQAFAALLEEMRMLRNSRK